jgi:hypothetical protein
MKSIKGFVPGLILGIGLGLSTIGFAQSAPQTNEKNAECCCAMASCCCAGDSCSLKDGAKEHSMKDGCCCCNGDSCKMKMKEKVKEKQE